MAEAASESLGEILGAALTSQCGAEWRAINAACDLIACHHCLDPDLVWSALVDLEEQCRENSGLPELAGQLQSPLGLQAVGYAVVKRVLGDLPEDLTPTPSTVH